jgi:hypothetical protein
MKWHIYCRTRFMTWMYKGAFDSFEQAEEYWRQRIEGQGITAWTEFVRDDRLYQFIETGKNVL